MQRPPPLARRHQRRQRYLRHAEPTVGALVGPGLGPQAAHSVRKFADMQQQLLVLANKTPDVRETTLAGSANHRLPARPVGFGGVPRAKRNSGT